MANAANVLRTTAGTAKPPGACFLRPERRLTTGPLKICTTIIRRTADEYQLLFFFEGWVNKGQAGFDLRIF